MRDHLKGLPRLVEADAEHREEVPSPPQGLAAADESGQDLDALAGHLGDPGLDRLICATKDCLTACLSARDLLQVTVREAHKRRESVREAAVVGSRVHEAENRARLAIWTLDDQVEIWSAAGPEKVSIPNLEPFCGAQRTYIPLSVAGTGRS